MGIKRGNRGFTRESKIYGLYFDLFLCISYPTLRSDVDQAPGCLGADVHWDASKSGYVVDSIVKGDVWDTGRCGPLVGLLGVAVSPGDVIIGINRRKFSPTWTLCHALKNMAHKSVFVTIRKYSNPDPAKPKDKDTPGRYDHGGLVFFANVLSFVFKYELKSGVIFRRASVVVAVHSLFLGGGFVFVVAPCLRYHTRCCMYGCSLTHTQARANPPSVVAQNTRNVKKLQTTIWFKSL